MMTVRSVRARIERLETLPAIPTVVRKLLETFENPRTSLREIGGFIAQDPVLAARILRVVNSPIYGFPGRISSITQALLLLGLNVARGLLLGVSVLELMQKSIVGLMEHSVGCAIVAKIIARKKGLKDPEEVSVAALLHDIGKVFLNLKFPDAYRQAIREADERGVLVLQTEKQCFGVTHAEVAAWVGKKWNFPFGLIEQLRCHHKPHLARHFRVHTAIVHFSDILIRGRGFGYSGDRLVPNVDESAWNLLSLTPDEIREILVEMEDLLDQAEDLICAGSAC
jgi:putative nucleotidyltransferase with HDIG domain